MNDPKPSDKIAMDVLALMVMVLIGALMMESCAISAMNVRLKFLEDSVQSLNKKITVKGE